MQENIIPHKFNITRKERSDIKSHAAFLLWFTGLSGSGKSTLANAVERELSKKEIHTYTLDGDHVRKGLCSNLGFSDEDRTENIRRIAEVANLMLDAGLVVLGAFVSPFEADRENVRRKVGAENYIEIFVSTPIEECERRDAKGLYAKARSGEIKDFTGVNAPYEIPTRPNIEIDTSQISLKDGVEIVLNYIEEKLTI